MTPHIEAKLEDIASIVIMPGDPKRVKYITQKYLSDYKLVNEVRGELAYTGYYKGKHLTIFSSGMGIPSMGIYSHELFNIYGVDVIIRVGSAGSYVSDLNVNDLFLVSESYSESNYTKNYNNQDEHNYYSNDEINSIIINNAKKLNIKLKVGKCHSTEAFYTKDFDIKKISEEKSCECVEMETFSLFVNAKESEKKAACLLTISDSLITGEKLSSEERETNFNNMIELALESSLDIKENKMKYI